LNEDLATEKQKGTEEASKRPLFKNAYFLMFSSLTSAGSGFFFWLIAARFYPAVNAGIASAIISATGLISMPSLFMVLLSRLYKYGYNPLREISL